MAKTGREVVFEGWLTKSPPTKRIWRARWRRRWFSLTHSGELPGQFILSYYTDRNKRKQKGVIDLDHCEQVDLGLKLEERKLKFDHVFDIKTPTRTYYLAADTESEMKSWVNCICRVCSLKATADDDDSHISINASCNTNPVGLERKEIVRNNQSLPTAVSTSPYIPISECITGTSPILDPQDLKALLAHNLKNSIYQNQFQSNDSYELPARNYINYVNDAQDPRFYDSPRKLGPRPEARNENEKEDLHSPNDCDSDSVFADDDDFDQHNTSAELNTSKKSRPSDSSTDVDMTVTQKFTKIRVNENVDVASKAPPRPPKPSHITSNYFKPSAKSENPEIDQINCSKYPENQKLITDDMYDFPRSHQGTLRNSSSRNHLYNNAASANMEDQIFDYESSPKTVSVPGQVFKYDSDDLTGVERSSPLSEGHSVAAYSNLPSPLLADSQLMPPPIVNRDLKPRRKLSDSPSIYSNAEPPSPRACQYGTQKKPGKEPGCHRRAAPSPVPSDILPSDNVEEQIYHFLPGGDNLARMQYLDLTFEPAADVQPLSSKPAVPRPRTPDHTTEYKEVDFMKTQAFNLTRNNLEMERSKGEEYGSKRGIDK